MREPKRTGRVKRLGTGLTAALLTVSAPLDAASPVYGRRAMVVAQEPLATDAGVEVLRSGGNAVDAAVAVAFVLAVTYPVAGNLGGGGFLLVRLAGGEAAFLDFREQAPAAAARGMYLNDPGESTEGSRVGWRAAGVPGTVKGLEHAHRKFGSKPWAELVSPAIRLAREGFRVSWALAGSLRSDRLLSKFDESRRIFLNGGRGYEPGDILRQPELADTLERIARSGAADFYEGETARRLAASMTAHGGLITRNDLAAYRVHERAPLRGRYREYEILTAPPPSSGGVGLLQMLAMLEGSGYEKQGPGAAAAIHYVAEVMRRFYADRSEHLADPDFHRVPLAGLLAPEYIAARRGSINPERATPSAEIGPGLLSGEESAETTHLSVVDPHGNAASLTYTINGGYGSGVTVPGLGFLLNNEMEDFAARPGSPNMFGLVQGEANRIEPGKRPLSSMTPTVVLRENRPYLVLGAPGGPRIINGVLQVILNVVDFRMGIQDAVNRPRFHHQWQPDRLYLEDGFSPDTAELLRRRGHAVESTGEVAFVEAILAEGDSLQGATDPRGHGKAAGW